jgi:hypothetical protein
MVWLFRKFIDRASFSSLGFDWKPYQYHAATGFFLGPLLMGAGTFILIAIKTLHWTDIHFDETQMFLNLGLMMIIAVAEETVFRGYILNNLLESMNKWIALGVSALIFAAFHANNPGITPIAIFNLFLGGLLLGVNYIFTRNLWFGILFHFSWNFYQGSVLGYKVSGVSLQPVLEQELTGNSLITGKEFGFEGSIFSGILCLLTTLLLAWIYEKKYRASKLQSSSIINNGVKES